MSIKPDWSTITTVLLDMDGTLLDLHFDNYFWLHHLPSVYAQQNNLQKSVAVEQLTPHFVELQGTLNWYSVEYWSKQLDMDIMQHKQDVADKIAYRPGAQQFLHDCRQQVQDLRLITNAHRKVLEMKHHRTNIGSYFDTLICSHELNAPKEQADFWHALQDTQKFDPHTTVFIDDSETVLDAARDYGIKYVYSIAEPDSVKPRVEPSKYPMIESLASLHC